MLSVLPALALVAPAFTPAQPWALGFAAPPRMPFAGDVDGDGMADLIVVYPPGDCIIDVNLTVEGVKSGGGFQGLTRWGRDCQAAAVGQFDGRPGTDVVGVFDGDTIRLAGGFSDGKFKDVPDWVKLPEKLESPALAVVNSGKTILAYSTTTGRAFRVDVAKRTVSKTSVPAATVWIGDTGRQLAAQDKDGNLRWMDPRSLRLGRTIAKVFPGSRPAAAKDFLAYEDKIWTPRRTHALQPTGLPPADLVRAAGDVDGDGDTDLLEFRYGSEKHTAHQVLLRRAVGAREKDPDHDGLDTLEEARLGTNPYDPDTDNDGLIDGWEVKGYRGLDLPGMGCSPLSQDVVCLVSRFEAVAEEKVKQEMERVIAFYRNLDLPNPDGSKGLRFHPIYLDPVTGDDTKKPWWDNRNKFRPLKWRGVVRWMQVTPGGGGQADQLGDGGGCGENAMWAAFVHEFGHQMGLSHEGFWSSGWSPTYSSLMNYNYSYALEDSRDLIRYSNGSLADFVLNETDLDETLPLPYERVKFLEKGPYRFRLKPNGDTTLIDWNWNGVFGEKNVKADVNYAYSTHAGRRDDVGKAHTSPWLFTHEGAAYVLFGSREKEVDKGKDPTLGPDSPGRLMLRKLVKPFEWEPPVVVEPAIVGEPAAASFGGKIHIVVPTAAGVVSFQVGDSKKTVLDPDPKLVPTVAIHQDRLLVFLWNPESGAVRYSALSPDGVPSTLKDIGFSSSNPIGACTDVKTGELVLGTAENQDDKRPNRWQIRRAGFDGEMIHLKSMDWIEGPDGQSRGTGRITVLFDGGQDAGPEGRIYFFCRGMTTAEAPWACTYVAQQIADKSVRGGWLVKRYYDEWTQSRSAPAATWFGDDILWSYRWVDGAQGPTDNNLHVGYNGLGIQSEPMGDHDDITYIRTFGIRNGILSLGKG